MPRDSRKNQFVAKGAMATSADRYDGEKQEGILAVTSHNQASFRPEYYHLPQFRI